MVGTKPWRIRTFGGLVAERDDDRVDQFRTRHAAVLLAFLALKADVRHSRETLVELLWPEADPITARQRLSTTLTSLRRQLETDDNPVFATSRETVGIVPGSLTSDAAEFETLLKLAKGASLDRRRELLSRAQSLADRGEFLPGFYFEWVVEHASALEEMKDSVRAELKTYARPAPRAATDPSSLVGREAEIERLDQLINSRQHCISLQGAGGVGKTRLALDAFERHASGFIGASAFVPLVEIRRPEEFLPAIARALKLPVGDGADLESEVCAALLAPSLVVLDNLEHLLPAVRDDLDRLVRNCGRCVFLCTSRRRLGISGERVVRIVPFPVPEPAAGTTVLLDSGAIQLFATRYQEAGGPALAPADLSAARDICAALGGLPLAIQLAASAAVTVGVEALRADRILYQVLRAVDPSQATDADASSVRTTLQGIIDWSLHLLDPHARSVLDFLALVPGAWRVNAVARLHSAEAASVLPRLHSDSLLEADGTGTMRLLEPVRERLLEHLDSPAREALEADLVRRCADVAEELGRQLEGPDQRQAFVDVTEFMPVMRRAAQLADERKLPNEGLRILIGLNRVFTITLNQAEAIALAEPLLLHSDVEPAVRACAEISLVRCHATLGQNAAVHRRAAAGLALAEKLGDPRILARAWTAEAQSAYIVERPLRTIESMEKAVAFGTEARDHDSLCRAQIYCAHSQSILVANNSIEEAEAARARVDAGMAAALAAGREAKDDYNEATVLYVWSNYAGSDLDLYRARLAGTKEICQRNGWKLFEAMARSALVRRLHSAGISVDILGELKALQETYRTSGRWLARATLLGTEAEVRFRMADLSTAAELITEALDVLQYHRNEGLDVEQHIQAMILAALDPSQMDAPLLAIVGRAGDSKFGSLMAELARGLLEIHRGHDDLGFQRLRAFDVDSCPVRFRHAYADTMVAAGDLVAARTPDRAQEAYRVALGVYREIGSAIDVRRVESKVSPSAP